MTDELLNERYALAIERIRQIPAEKVPQPYRDFCITDGTVPLQNGPDPSRIAEGYLKQHPRRAGCFNREPYEDVIETV